VRTMTEQQARDFLSAGTRTAKLATVREDGRPHVAPIWFVLDDDGTLVFTTGAGTMKGRAIQRHPAVCLCVDDEAPPFAFVMVDGTAETSEDPDTLLEWAIRIGARYMGPDQAEAYGRRNGVPGELLVRVTPTRIVAKDRIAD
jgi:PPOX class probable F420-dependent enzyme